MNQLNELQKQSMDSKNKTKIVQVIADSALGGGPRHVLGLINNLDKEIFDVLLIAPRGWLTTRAQKISGVNVRIVEFKNKFDLDSFIKLRKCLAEFRSSGDPFAPMIIHSHGPRAASFCRYALQPKDRFVYTEHLWNSDYHLRNPLNSLMQKNSIRSICRRADRVIAVSASVGHFLVNVLGIDRKKISIISNAIEIEGDNLRKNNPGLLVGTVGSLVKAKGQIYLIKAFERVLQSLPKARLEIVGDGPEKDRLLKEIKDLGLESQIQLVGKVEKPKKLIKTWDIFALPSLSETFGLVILEAFECHVPVVGSNIGGIPELIKNGETGMLVPPADPEKLAKAICYLLVEKRERQKIADHAFELLKDKYEWSKIIKEIEKEYLRLVK